VAFGFGRHCGSRLNKTGPISRSTFVTFCVKVPVGVSKIGIRTEGLRQDQADVSSAPYWSLRSSV
jgi:hypothetical protein